MNRRQNKLNATKYLVITAMLMTAMQMVQAADIYLNVADGNWTNASSWNPAQVPVAGDNARIDGDRVVRITDDVACANFAVGYNGGQLGTAYLESGNLTLSANLELGQWGNGIRG